MMITFLDILDRAYTGPLCEPKDWDMKIIPSRTTEKVRKYGIKCDTENPICTDDSLADDVFKAGFELALDTGVLCLNTKRIMKIEEEELKEAVREAPSELNYGEGADKITVKARKPEGKTPPTVSSGPYGTVCSEELWIPIHQSFAQCRLVDAICPGILETVYARRLRPGTPYEVLGGMLEAQLTKIAVTRAGRPGMPIAGVETTISGLGYYGGFTYGALTLADWPFVSASSELKTEYRLLSNAAYTVGIGANLQGYHHVMLGGFAGGPEGAAIMRVASELLLIPLYNSKAVGSTCIDVRYASDCSRESVWANSVAAQAVSRNTHLIVVGQDNPVSGPCTDVILYEGAVAAINETVGGSSGVVGIRPTTGILNNTTGLEGKWLGEVVRATTSLNRDDTNDIVKEIIPKYEEKLKSPPKGKPFQECFNMKTLKPSKEWIGIYRRVRNELIDIGLPLNTY